MFGVTLVILLALWATAIPMAFGWQPVSIVSGSMAPLIGVGDVIVAEPYTGQELLPGSVIVFEDPVWGGMVSHRIESTNEDGTLTTRGDANRSADSTPVGLEAVVGIGRILVPEIGWPTVWAKVGNTQALVLATVCWLAMLYAARWGAFARFDPWNALEEPAPAAPPPTPRRGRHLRKPHRSGLRPVIGIGTILGLIVASLTVGVSSAVLASTTANSGSALAASSDFSYNGVVLADNPSFWWRLGEAPAGGGSTFTDDFETFAGWNTYQSGTFTGTIAQAHSGNGSGIKNTANDPSGGWKQLGFTTGTNWTMEAWIARPAAYSGGAADRVALENSGFNGYGMMINHSGNTLVIERRTGGTAATLATTAFDPPENQWFRITLARTGSSFTAAVYDSSGGLLASASATDSTHGGADRFVVHGGYEYYVDDITVTSAGSSTTIAVDTRGNLNGTYTGSPSLGQPSLVDGEADTATAFTGANWVTLGDHSLLNLTTRAERTVELWFRANTTTGRQVLYEEGGSTNGMVIYLEGSALRARAWSASTGWANELDTTTSISAGQIYHVVVTLDTNASRNLVLYLNGSPVSSASKSDTNDWSTHSDDGGIAAQNGSSKYHDGTFGATGTNFFTGSIDDVAIYNSLLSASRVYAHWIAGTP